MQKKKLLANRLPIRIVSPCCRCARTSGIESSNLGAVKTLCVYSIVFNVEVKNFFFYKLILENKVGGSPFLKEAKMSKDSRKCQENTQQSDAPSMLGLQSYVGLIVVLQGHGDDVDADDEGYDEVQVVVGAQRVDHQPHSAIAAVVGQLLGFWRRKETSN